MCFFIGKITANTGQNFFERIQTEIEEPLKLRDPFKSQLQSARREAKAPTAFLENNAYSNVPTLGNVTLDQIVVTGVLLGKERMATVKIRPDPTSTDTEPESYVIKEGRVLGRNRAEVRAILPGGVGLVERLTNVYEQEEYIETIIPITGN